MILLLTDDDLKEIIANYFKVDIDDIISDDDGYSIGNLNVAIAKNGGLKNNGKK